MIGYKRIQFRRRLGVVLILVLMLSILVVEIGMSTVVSAQGIQNATERETVSGIGDNQTEWETPSGIGGNQTEWETPSGIGSTQIEYELDSIFDSYIGKTVQGATIAIVKEGKIVYEKGYGYADRENNRVVDPATTVFEYGSATKLFTWVSAMQLAEVGELDLDKDIRSYIPSEYQLEISAHKPVTMLNLMNHTAGFDDYLIGLFTRKDNYTEFESGLKENVPQQIYEPGEVCSYSNYGAALAGYIVQNVANQEEYKYVREHIFDTLGMKKVTMSISNTECEELLKDKSKGYTANGYDEKTKEWRFTDGKWT